LYIFDNLLDDIINARSDLLDSTAFRNLRKKYGIEYFYNSTETTYSENYSFHPHHHELFFMKKLSHSEYIELRERLLELWQFYLRKHGLDCNRYGLDLRQGTKKNIGKYVSKMAREMTLDARGGKKADRQRKEKKSYTISELVDLGFSGVKWAEDRFIEYASAISKIDINKEKRCSRKLFFASKGLRKDLLFDMEKAEYDFYCSLLVCDYEKLVDLNLVIEFKVMIECGFSEAEVQRFLNNLGIFDIHWMFDEPWRFLKTG